MAAPGEAERAPRAEEVEASDAILRKVITEYTREAGVRQLERELGSCCAARRRGSPPVRRRRRSSSSRTGDRALGRQRFFQESVERTAIPGVATGLAVTGTGGDVLFIEATAMEGEKGLVLTGQLGDVMKESARIALSYVSSHADELGIDPDAFRREFHVHVPAGAIPKDGPSAGTAMTTALASLLSGRPVKHTVGMTGEVTLQGRVLPIGGLKQKVLAAHAAGLTEVILPERNRGDLDDVPEEVREQMTFHPVMSIGEVLELALEPAGQRSGCRRGVVTAHRFPPSSAPSRSCWSAAGRWARSMPAPAALCVSTSSGSRYPGSRRRRSRSASSSSRPPGSSSGELVSGRPPHAEYRLTPKGKRLATAVSGLLQGR